MYTFFAGATDRADAGDPCPAQCAGLAAGRAAPSLARAAGALGQAGEDWSSSHGEMEEMEEMWDTRSHVSSASSNASSNGYSKEVWKLNFRQYEQMEEDSQEEAQTWRKSEGRR